MSRFMKYPSLVNHYAIGSETRITSKMDELWYSTEKIHGANVSIIKHRNGETHLAKRTGLISDDDKQFSELKSVISNSVYDSINRIFEKYKFADLVNVFGEFYGSGIQSMDYDINHANEKYFKVFDVFVHFKNTNPNNRYVLSLLDIKTFFKEEDVVPFLDLDTLRNLLDEEPEQTSNLGGNREGDVYKPFYGYVIDEKYRFIGVKHKLDSFSETVKKSSQKTKEKYGLQEIQLREDLKRYVTKNRVLNVLSHGEVEFIEKNIGRIITLVKEDIEKEYIAENSECLDKTISIKKITNFYSRDIALLIKEVIKEQS